MGFRLLHLSDIHYMSDASSENARTRIIDELGRTAINDGAVDCVVVTGDFMHQGKYQDDNQNCITFLKDVCDTCLKQALREDWFNHIVFCPGNHDLDRGAAFYNANEKRIISRKEVLKRVASTPERITTNNIDEYTLLTENTFRLYRDAIHNKLSGVVTDNYEYSVFEKAVPEDESQKIVFVALNTALYAGQIREKSEIQQELSEQFRKLQEFNSSNYLTSNQQTYGDAKDAYKDYLDLHRELIHGEANDEGRLCYISSNSETSLKNKLTTVNRSPIQPICFFLGHHPLNWLSLEAKRHFGNLAYMFRAQENAIYLCGHEHLPAVKKEMINYSDGAMKTVIMLEVGGDFADSSKWNVPSFGIYEIVFEENGGVYLEGSLFCYCKGLKSGSIEFASTRSYDYVWQKFEFGGADQRIRLRTAEGEREQQSDGILQSELTERQDDEVLNNAQINSEAFNDQKKVDEVLIKNSQSRVPKFKNVFEGVDYNGKRKNNLKEGR